MPPTITTTHDPATDIGHLPHKNPARAQSFDLAFGRTRAHFQAWCQAIGGHFGYRVEFLPIGPVDAATGSPTQMGVFTAFTGSQVASEMQSGGFHG
jgi:hypothetical protein